MKELYGQNRFLAFKTHRYRIGHTMGFGGVSVMGVAAIFAECYVYGIVTCVY